MVRADRYHRLLLIIASLALLAAAGLVIQLQRQSTERREQQTRLVVDQLCRQTALGVAQRLASVFGAAVWETIEGIGHPDLRRWDLPRIARYFEAGTHTYVHRYFLWSRAIDSRFRDEVLFYRNARETGPTIIDISDGDGSHGGLYSDRPAGVTILSLANRFEGFKRSFTVVEETLHGRPHQIVIHYLWDDDSRHEVFAIIGYTIDLTEVRHSLFPKLIATRALSLTGTDEVQPQLTVQDSEGNLVFGGIPDRDTPSTTTDFDLLFFPSNGLRPWLAAEPPGARWHLTVSAPLPAGDSATAGYWLFGAVVFLILIGLMCAVTLDRRSRHLSQMQSEFVANVSHQLKTPLALLSGAAETLEEGRIHTPDKLQEYSGIVRTQAARLSALVDQTILCSIADGGVGGLQFELTDVVMIVRGAVEEFRAGVPSTIEITFSAAGSVPLVRADPAALEQVVWNFLENALKYGDQEHNRIDVSVSAEGRHVVIAVRDRGDGIDASDLPRVFDRFYRGRNGHRPRGFGLGLAYAQKVVKAHRGRVAVESEIGRGSEFRVIIPAA